MLEQQKSALGGLAKFKQLEVTVLASEVDENYHMSRAIVRVFRKFASINKTFDQSVVK